jgi:protoheme IX farnesyltransferase
MAPVGIALRKWLKTLVVLFKLRVVVLLLFAAFGGLMLGAHGRPPLAALPLLVVTGTLAAGGASALNEYLERDADAQMQRTRRRPLAVGRYTRPARVAAVGLAMIAVSMLLALVAGRPDLAFFLGLGAFIYVVVYTVVLKPNTPLNIVLGGAAGSAAVLSGGAAVGAWQDPGVVLLAALVFVWTPTHFWSLSMVYRDDYMRTGVPMLPAVMAPPRAAFWMVVHAVATGAVALLLVAHPALGLVYLVPVAPATVWLLRESARLLRNPERAQALGLFKASNIYLALVLLAVCVDALL